MILLLRNYDIFTILKDTMDNTGRKILVIFDKEAATDRLMISGILRYAREKCNPPWEVQLELRNVSRLYTSKIAEGGFSGIIAEIVNPADRRRYFKSGLPTVLYEPWFERMDHSARPENNITFFNDHAAEGRTAAEYFLERGFKSFAYVGTPKPVAWSVARQTGFAARLKKSGKSVKIYPTPCGKAAEDFTLEAPSLIKWLKRLPPQTALFTTHDLRAQQITTLARRAKIRIPEDIAVLGVDDDQLICETASPPISSIQVFAAETGWRIARAMHDLLDAREHPRVVRTCHTNIVSRRSTDVFAVGDSVIAKAMTYASNHLDEDLSVKKLAEISNCSVRTLQMKMMRTLNRTVKDEIANLKLAKAVKLLSETLIPISEIARKCGYCSSSHMSTKIKAALGKTPLAIRKNPTASFASKSRN